MLSLLSNVATSSNPDQVWCKGGGMVFGLDPRVLRIVYTLGVCYLVYRLRGVLFLLLLGVIAAYIVLPAVEFAFRFITHKHHRGRALAIVFVAILVILTAVGAVIGYYAFQQASMLASQIPSLLDPDAIRHIQLPKFLDHWSPQIRTFLENWRESHGKDILQTLTSATLKLLTAMGSVLSLLIVGVLGFLLLKDGESYVHAAVGLVPERYQPAARSFVHDMHNMLKHWTRAMFLVALATVLLYGIGFSLLRVPYSVLLAILAFPFEFVPMIGPPVAFAIILLVAYFVGYHHLLWLCAIFVLARVIADYVLQPYFMSSGSVELAPIVVIFGALAGEAIAGVPGLLLSVPVIATIRLLYRHLRDSRSNEIAERPQLSAVGNLRTGVGV
jgi:predicted PurR-regulated permease PerM